MLDLDLTTDITHTWANDLEITLVSPAGTTVVITTDNGGGNDDVFSGTLWDDQAGNTATGFAYANLVTATPLIPEGAMGAFVGEDPNGTWVLNITDDEGLDTGILNSWSLDITTVSPSQTRTGPDNIANSTATPIPDVGNIQSNVEISGLASYVCELTMTTDITHTYAADLDITLTSPAGTSQVITTDNGGRNDDVFSGTSWDDRAGNTVTDFAYANLVTATPLIPEGAMAAFMGEDPNGTWVLSITDDAGADTGTLNSWSLNVTTCAASANPGPNVIPEPKAVPGLSTVSYALLMLVLMMASLFMLRRRV